MRLLILIAFAVFAAAPAIAQDGEHYDNAGYGYGVDIPPGFESTGALSDGGGMRFYKPSGGQGIMVWGYELTGDLESEVALAIDYAVAENGWTIIAQVVTPRWARFLGMADGQMVYQHMILLCDGQSYAAFRANYGQRDRAEMDALFERMAQTLKRTGC